MEKLDKALEIIERTIGSVPSLYSVALYGSAARKEDFIESWSDIDLLIVVDACFKIPRRIYECISHWYFEVTDEIGEKLEINIHDKGNVMYGKLDFLTESFKHHLRKEAITIYGSEIRDILSPHSPEGIENYIAHSLWITRKNYVSRMNGDYKSLREATKQSLKAFKNFVLNACLLKSGYIKSWRKQDVLESFKFNFPEFKTEEIEELLSVPKKWNSINNRDELLELLYSSVKLREEIVKALVEWKKWKNSRKFLVKFLSLILLPFSQPAKNKKLLGNQLFV